ncbi:MAG: histidine kinase, partial [Bacillota bacterium]|nr:histidine kinase [Bacillota bacterium]
YVPEDSPTVITSANKGFPFVMTRAETKVAKAIITMAGELTDEKVVVQNEKSGIKKLLGI